MNIANVCDRFSVLAGLETEEAAHLLPLAEDACAYVQERCRVSEPDEAQMRRLELLAAAYALRLYSLRGGQLQQFTAGDVRLTAAAGWTENAGRLWRELAADSTDLIKNDDFLFGRVI